MRPRTIVGIAAVLVLVAATLAGAIAVQRQEDRKSETQQQLVLREVAGNLQAELVQTLGTVESAGVVMRSNTAGERAYFAGLAELALRRKGLVSLSWMPRITEGARAGFERRLRQPLWNVDLLARRSRVGRPGAGPYFPIAWIYPTNRQGVVGFDSSSNVLVGDAFQRAAISGTTALSPPVPAGLRSTATQAAVFHPVYRVGMPHATEPQRRRALVGLVGASVRVDRLRSVTEASRLGLRVSDDGAVLAGPAQPSGSQTVSERLRVGSREWALSAPVPPAPQKNVLIVVMIGLGVSGLMALIVWQSARKERYALDLVQTRLAERDTAERELSRERDYSRTMVEALQDGLLVVDHDLVVVEANERFCAMIGAERSEVIGAQAPLPGWLGGSADERSVAAAAFERAHETTAGFETELSLHRPERRPVWVIMTAAPLHDESGASNGHMISFKDISARRLAEEALAAQASTDHLTGLANHRTFHDRLAAAVDEAHLEGEPLSLVVVDLDHFKAVNDEHGHMAGDETLREVARRLRGVARRGDTLARVGGEEFGWLLPGIDAEGALMAAERARLAICREPVAGVGTVTISAGVCAFDQGPTAADLYRLADGALYWAKAHGRNQCCQYTPEVVQALSAEEHAGRLERRQTITTIRALARAVDAKDASTRRHSERVADLSAKIARALGWSSDRIELLHGAALVHDVGKIGVPDAVLFKPGPLTKGEYEQIVSHASLGAQIVSGALSEEQGRWVRGHHERWDGGGYPDGLAGMNVPEGARILALADSWDVMTVARNYSAPRTLADASGECEHESGRQFWPDAVTALLRMIDDGEVVIPTGDDPSAVSTPLP